MNVVRLPTSYITVTRNHDFWDVVIVMNNPGKAQRETIFALNNKATALAMARSAASRIGRKFRSGGAT